MQVEIDVPNRDYKLSRECMRMCRLQIQNDPNALTVPVQAVDQSGSKTHGAGGRCSTIAWRSARSQTGMEDANRVEILSGLNEGDRVIVGNLGSFQPGAAGEPTAERSMADCSDSAERRVSSMSGFAIRYPFFIIMLCLIIAVVGVDDGGAHAGGSVSRRSTFRWWWWPRSTPACRRSRSRPTSPTASSASSRWAAASITSSRARCRA